MKRTPDNSHETAMEFNKSVRPQTHDSVDNRFVSGSSLRDFASIFPKHLNAASSAMCSNSGSTMVPLPWLPLSPSEAMQLSSNLPHQVNTSLHNLWLPIFGIMFFPTPIRSNGMGGVDVLVFLILLIQFV